MSFKVEIIKVSSTMHHVHADSGLEGTDFCGRVVIHADRATYSWGWRMSSRYTPEQRAVIEAAANEKALLLNIERRLTT